MTVGWAFATALLVVMVAGCGGSKTPTTSAEASAAGAKADAGMAADPADEVCSAETKTNVIGQLAHQAVPSKLTRDPIRLRSGTRTSCTYEVIGGSMELAVHQQATNEAAQRHFDEMKSTSGAMQVVPNLGTSAFTRSDGSTVTVLDEKVLVVDTSMLPPGNDKSQISQSISFEILACWTG